MLEARQIGKAIHTSEDLCHQRPRASKQVRQIPRVLGALSLHERPRAGKQGRQRIRHEGRPQRRLPRPRRCCAWPAVGKVLPLLTKFIFCGVLVSMFTSPSLGSSRGPPRPKRLLPTRRVARQVSKRAPVLLHRCPFRAISDARPDSCSVHHAAFAFSLGLHLFLPLALALRHRGLFFGNNCLSFSFATLEALHGFSALPACFAVATHHADGTQLISRKCATGDVSKI